MCGWGGEGIDLRTPHEKKLSPVLNKSRKWKVAVSTSVIVAALILPSLAMFPINEARADNSIEKAKEQMDKHLYASAAKTLYLAPHTLVSSGKKAEVRELLTSNVRWGKDTANIKGAKASLLKDDPEAALAELSNLDDDFPLGDEATDLIDLAQELDLEGDIDISDDMLNDIASIPDDPELANINNLGVDISEEPADLPSSNPSINDDTLSPDLEIPEPSLSATDKEELSKITPPKNNPDPQELPDSESAATSPKLRVFFHLFNSTSTDNLYTIDSTGEVRPGKDRKSNQSGFKSKGNLGKIYNRSIKGYENRIIPIYRYYSAKNTDHYYTANPNFSSGSTKSNYQRQLVAGYIGRWSQQQNKCFAGKIPLYNVYNPNQTTNFYSNNKKEVSELVAKKGYKNLRIIGCIWPS